ncbi:hypothetical protein ACFLYF_06580, partial [Chloroflexota bacterium]
MKKKFGFLALVLVLLLGSLGVGYAAWTDTIYIDGTVSTGEVCVKFGPSISIDDSFCYNHIDPPYLNQPYDWNSTPGVNFPGRAYQVDKNVACAFYQLNDAHDLLTLTFDNVYPYYYNHTSFWVCNCGTVPVKIQKFVFRNAAGEIIGTVEKGSTNASKFMEFDLDNNGTLDFQVQWGDDSGDQLEPEGCADVSFGVLM